MFDPVHVLIGLNVVVGLGCAVPLAKFLEKVFDKYTRTYRYFLILIIVYFVEGISMAMGMGIPVFSVGLAFVWGIVFGMWLRTHTSVREVLKTTLFLSLYTCLPAVSFFTIPVMVGIDGRNILSVEEAIRFGIPELPPFLWPFCTILGFYVVLAVGAVLFKTVITTGEVSLLIHLGKTGEE